jgi:UDP-N-acetylmuramyl pentapeptide phosphotransferase/UDP-N-acetylglucosamine-1-phosphate transferase
LQRTFATNASFRTVYWFGRGPAGRLSCAREAFAARFAHPFAGHAQGMTTTLACVVSLVLAAVAVTLMLKLARRLPVATPNARSLHVEPVPRVGGLALWAGFLPAASWVAADLPGGAIAWLPAWLALVAISLVDDARGAPVVARLAVHAAAALWTAAWILRVPWTVVPGVAPGTGYLVAVMLAALVIVWSSNLYNFMDGSDGLAGGMTLVGFAALALAAANDTALRISAAALAAASIPFLAVNRPPARLFMGDVGAVPAGYLAATFAIAGVARGLWPAWFPVLVFLPFAADATATLARRLVRGERVWEAHRSHYYQRLHQLGAGHAGTLALYGAAALGCALTALACLAYAPGAGATALIAWCAAFAVLFAAIDYHWRRRPSATR